MEGMHFVIVIIAISFSYALISNFMKLYFRTKDRRINRPGDGEELGQLYQRAEDLADRIDKLESILDKDLPGWRNRI